MKADLKRMDRKRKIFLVKFALVIFVVGFWLVVFIDFDLLFNNERVTLWIHAPSIVEENEKFEINIQAWDKYERISSSYDEEIGFSIESYNYTTFTPITAIAQLPSDYLFTTNYYWGGIYPAYTFESVADNGRRSFEVNISTPGIHYIVVKEPNGDSFRSNPIIVRPTGEATQRLYWGDIHAHTTVSDGSGTPEEAYLFARDVANLDYAALTDHSELMPSIGDVNLFNVFQNYIDTTNRFNDDGTFATLVAMEYTPMVAFMRSYLSPQHLNVYFEGDTMPFYSSFDFVNADELIEYIQQNTDDEFITWTHHETRNSQPSDFAYYHEDVMPMVEIYSCHGSAEVIGEDNWYPEIGEVTEPGYSVRDALKMGCKFGIMASSDTHDGRMGHSILHTDARALNQFPYTIAAYQYGVPYPGSLTGLYTPSLTRQSIFNALKTRAGYATTWVNRHFVNFSINGLMVGVNDSTVQVPTATTNRTIDILVCLDGISMAPNQNTTIDKIDIIKNSEVWATKTKEDIGDKFLYHWVINDTEAITGAEYTDCIQKPDGNWYIHQASTKPVDPAELNTNGVDYYYIRIHDSNNGAAWIGPIWVEIK